MTSGPETGTSVVCSKRSKHLLSSTKKENVRGRPSMSTSIKLYCIGRHRKIHMMQQEKIQIKVTNSKKGGVLH